AVARQLLLVQPEVGRAVGGEGVQLDEAALVEQGVDALAGALLAAGVLLLLRRRLGPLEGGVPGGEVRELRRGAGEISGVGGHPASVLVGSHGPRWPVRVFRPRVFVAAPQVPPSPTCRRCRTVPRGGPAAPMHRRRLGPARGSAGGGEVLLDDLD